MIGRQEPPPISENWSWQLDAACRGMPSAQFFHPWNERGSDRESRIEQAKRICAGCPVIDTCHRHALQAQEMYGIWGGMSEDERMVLLNRRRRRSRR
jgi:WhiB family redox-sensing transcriptional regulator